MPDLLLISSMSTSLEEAQTGKTGADPTFSLRYIKFRDDNDLEWWLNGFSLKDMPDGSVMDQGMVRPPDGSPPGECSIGYLASCSQKQALEVARAALANPASEIRCKGFSEHTPIYLWHGPGQRQELL
jgi:hypothetical protein